MRKITDGVYFIQGQDETIPDSHAYVIGETSSRDLSLVDGGLMGKAEYKLESILGLDSTGSTGFKLEDIKRIIMTHTHVDHFGCVSKIREKLPWAELWIHTAEAEHLEQGDERIVYGMDMFRQMCQAQFGLKVGDFALKVDRKLQGADTLQIGGMNWEVLHIPGHSPGSIALYEKGRKVLIPGDVVYADHAIGRFDLEGSDASELKDSLSRLSELEVDILLPGHNRVVEKDLKEGYILETLKQWEPYLV